MASPSQFILNFFWSGRNFETFLSIMRAPSTLPQNNWLKSEGFLLALDRFLGFLAAFNRDEFELEKGSVEDHVFFIYDGIVPIVTVSVEAYAQTKVPPRMKEILMRTLGWIGYVPHGTGRTVLHAPLPLSLPPPLLLLLLLLGLLMLFADAPAAASAPAPAPAAAPDGGGGGGVS